MATGGIIIEVPITCTAVVMHMPHHTIPEPWERGEAKAMDS